jgi:uncharacterized protein (DUF2132 family)
MWRWLMPRWCAHCAVERSRCRGCVHRRVVALTLALMDERQPNNPLHGHTLEGIVRALVEHYGFARLAELIPINCFLSDPSIGSSLKFLRRMPWARTKVEALFVQLQEQREP